MKSKFLLSFLILCAGTLLFWSNSGGAAASGNGNRTGSPGSTGTCATCHSGGSFAPVTTVDITDSQGNSVTTVMADSIYDISVSISATGTPSGYGFQAIIVDDADNESVGSLRTAGSGVQFTSISGTNNEVAEHSSTSANGTFTFSWQAPTTGSASFTIYAFGNAVNGNSGGTGDAASGDNITLDFVAQTSSVESSLADEVELNLFPNPVVNQLNVKMTAENYADYSLRIFAANGQEIRSQQLQAVGGEQQIQLDVTDLSVGAYRVVLQDEEGRMLTKSFVKF
jgi:hypothetical protein